MSFFSLLSNDDDHEDDDEEEEACCCCFHADEQLRRKGCKSTREREREREREEDDDATLFFIKKWAKSGLFLVYFHSFHKTNIAQI